MLETTCVKIPKCKQVQQDPSVGKKEELLECSQEENGTKMKSGVIKSKVMKGQESCSENLDLI